MKFNERLKKLREGQKLTQIELAKRAGISSRMIQKYEYGISRPRLDAAEKLASAFGIPVSEFLGESEMLIAQSAQQYGSRGAKQAKQLMEEVTGLFAGGEMAEEDMDVMMKAISNAYWIAKENNRKYAPKSNQAQKGPK